MASLPTTASSEHASPTLGSTQGASCNPGSSSARSLSINRNVIGTRFIVVMGVSGTGKSTLGMALSRALHLPFIDGDDLHPAANVAKMSRGEPLDDVDRWPWLETIRKRAVACVPGELGEDGEVWGPGVIVACSSLKKAYRAVLRGETQPEPLGSTSESLPAHFVYLKGDRDVLMARMENRQGHFMKAGMLESQLDALESPEGEPGVVTVSVDMSTAEQVQRVVEVLGSSS